ncbi:hypothetical protein ACFFLZ_02480 [Photobacterium aphoticum]|uniref:Exonuclease domain-containing protein n=1 Tax=Photobacterium aphoticum TaxID=754436 RepID=A0A090RBT9_9GAMM|nr:hypothetical protein [Photobacterium aphoticum]KLV03051.1 hypothetical protein ABT58_00535 [Photobacterium aphoticum]PSU57983.1 hypothetical protein C9I90_07885 [Photobacterium aphoticum]GAL05012.1 hypothetical protein JCM19237_4378 [Photobacterium aphoticum]GHA60867.1 hypothetical protein GCM10007086_38370 [Photobacterium aphoticum]
MWATLDFEASGLSEQSYPIEVGYSLPDGTGNSLLINPLTASDVWQYWDDYAEQEIHQISRQILQQDGMQVVEVCQHLNAVLGQYEQVFCDSQWDLFWLGRLYHAAHMRPSFTLTEVGMWLLRENGIERSHFQQTLANLGPSKHRAEWDAKQIRQAIDQLTR